MMIRDVNAQVEKAISEIEMRYSKGLKFTIYDLLATQSCEGASNFSLYKNSLQAKLSPKRIAQLHSTRNGINTYIKL
ncbi:hypothetical protein HUW86_05195 [Fusobacterium sp. SB021]|uniref:hypothetical protein n=1 Tax=Fusobacterium sp. SB021 TaxID=2744227 RepID=UPI003CEA0FCD